jgi:prepilin-type N-terminal cleavage/methylation domain-containing protein
MKTIPTNQKRRGFTIIEVMIVLTIAGLILLIVFLAVPALQRNSRNTQRRADVSKMLGAIGDYQSNHNGQLPATAQFSTAFAESNPTMGYYTTAGNLQWDYSAAARGADPAWPAAALSDSVSVYNYAKCSSATAVTRANANQRSVVALFAVEGSGGLVNQCVES